MRVPLATVGLVAPTVALTVAHLRHPGILFAVRRDPELLAAGQWWRVISPILVQPDPLVVTLLVFAMVIAAGWLCERALGPGRTAVLYIVGGLAGEAVGYLWQPHGAGCSVAGCGCLGGLCALWIRSPGLPRRFALSWLVVAVVDALLRDIHGAPILAGALVGAALAARTGRSATAGS
jgi:rhomboid protease GluP